MGAKLGSGGGNLGEWLRALTVLVFPVSAAFPADHGAEHTLPNMWSSPRSDAAVDSSLACFQTW